MTTLHARRSLSFLQFPPGAIDGAREVAHNSTPPTQCESSLQDLQVRIRSAQVRAALSVNRDLTFCWSTGLAWRIDTIVPRVPDPNSGCVKDTMEQEWHIRSSRQIARPLAHLVWRKRKVQSTRVDRRRRGASRSFHTCMWETDRGPKTLYSVICQAFNGTIVGTDVLGCGRTSAHIRKVTVPVVYTNFLSMYPTVNSLMDLWRFVTALAQNSGVNPSLETIFGWHTCRFVWLHPPLRQSPILWSHLVDGS